MLYKGDTGCHAARHISCSTDETPSLIHAGFSSCYPEGTQGIMHAGHIPCYTKETLGPAEHLFYEVSDTHYKRKE